MNEEKKVKKSKAGVYLAGILIFIGIILLAIGSSSTSSNYNSITEQWEWPLTTGWNDVTFTQIQLLAIGSTLVEDVVESIIDYVDVVFYENVNGDWVSWVKDAPYNSLTNIVPGDYKVYVTQDCVLTIGSVDPPDDPIPPVDPPDTPPYVEIETSSWVTSASGLLCIFAGIGVGVKTKWF